jgi:hypothetical protein
MWRRTYLLLLLVRIYFAFSPSYLHPDENFQGPEVLAGEHVAVEILPKNPPRTLPDFPAPEATNKHLRQLFSCDGGTICDRWLTPLDRANILVSSRIDMGVYIGASYSQRFSIMDRLRLADEYSKMVLQRGRG